MLCSPHFRTLGPRSLASSVSAPLMMAIMRGYIDEHEEWQRPEQRTICIPVRVFPHGAVRATWLRGSTINRVIGLAWAKGFPMEDSQVEGSLPQVAGDAHFSTQGVSELRGSPTWGNQRHSGMRGFLKHVGPTPLASKALGKAQSWTTAQVVQWTQPG